MITYAVGDLHGRFDLLQKAWKAANTDLLKRSIDGQFIILGDMIDRGPETSQLIGWVRSVMSEPNPTLKLLAIRGNHEDIMLKCIQNPSYYNINWWFGNGGYQTMQSYGWRDGLDVVPFSSSVLEDARWLLTLPYYYETERQVFVHAFAEPGIPMADQDPGVMTWVCYDEAYKWPNGATRPLKESDYHKHVVHGHEQWADGPKLLKTRTDLDTFAWYTGRLAIGVFDDSQGEPIDILWAEDKPVKSP
jgi:serine/threonine protein phosphatase 1